MLLSKLKTHNFKFDYLFENSNPFESLLSRNFLRRRYAFKT